MKKILFVILGLIFTLACFSQHSIKGIVLTEDNIPLQSATVVLLNPADSTMELFDVTNQMGEYSVINIKIGKYLIQYAFVGYETVYKLVNIPADNDGDLGITEMKEKLVSVDEVSVVGEYIPIRIKQDTIEFNSKAFKTKPDAVVEELLKKLPGVEVDAAGNIKAMGKDVLKVLVDGKEFFGNDLKVATKNLPADVIDKVQIYDRKSDLSEFTGVDDGVRDRTINLILQEDKKKGFFGDILAGIGTEKHYNTSGKIFRFTNKIQMAALGMFNNINQFGLKGGDFGQKAEGLNTAGAGGFNFSYNPKPDNRYFISYLANGTKSILERETYTQNFIVDGSYNQEDTLDQTTRDTTHSVNYGIRTRIGSSHNLIMDGNINLAKSNVLRLSTQNRFMNDFMINNLDNRTDTESDRINWNTGIYHVYKINEDRTQLTTKMNFSSNYNFSGSTWNNFTTFYNPERKDSVNNFQDNTTNRFNASVRPSLVQRIGRLWYISPNLAIGMNQHLLDREQGIPGFENSNIDSLSPEFERNYRFFGTGLSIQRNTEKNQLNINFTVEWSELDKILWENSLAKSKYFFFKPGISYQSEYRSGRRINLRYTSGINLPSTSQLLPVVNTINPLSLHRGNIDLEPEKSHNISSEWSIFDSFSFTSFFARLNASYTKDKINWSRTINEKLEQTVKPVNVDDDYRAGAGFDFSTPIRRLGIVISAKLNENWNRGINVINSENNINTNLTHSFRLTIDNRKKNIWDASIGASVSMTDTWYSIQEELNNRYFNFSYFTDIRFIPSDHWNFRCRASVINYNSMSFNESLQIPLIGAEINYYFLSGKRAVITLAAVDILNKNTSFQRISDINYLMQRRTNVLGRYIMLTFKYRMNKFGGSKGAKTKY